MGNQYTIEQGAGGVVTLYEKSVTGNSYVTLKAPGVNIKGTKGFGYSDEWSFSHDLPQDPALGGKGLKVQFGKSEQGTDVIVKGYSADIADVVGAKPLDFVISFDPQGKATNLKVGASFSVNGASASAGFSIDPHNPTDASQIRSITYDPNGNTYVTQYNISSRKEPYALIKVYGPTGLLIDEIQRPIDPDFAAQISSGFLSPTDHCFVKDTPIQMWPTDPSIKPRDDGSYDEELVLSKIWEKPISEIRIVDLVVAYDDRGRLAPKTVTRTMTNTAKHILDFWGTGVTPGHAYFCADGEFKGQHVPLLDILRTDGTIMKSDGTQIRAATGCEVGSIHDRFVHAVVGDKQPNGKISIREQGQVRLGTRVILENGEQHCVLDILNANGAQITEDGYIRSGAEGAKVPLSWTFSEQLPKPEDYILRSSKVTLEEIYAAGEWEQIGPRLPAPDGSKASPQLRNATSVGNKKPLATADGMRQPTRALNRKQRKALEAKQRKAAKAGKRLAS